MDKSGNKDKNPVLRKHARALKPETWQGAALSLGIGTAVLFFGIFIGGGMYSFFNGMFNLGFAVLLFVLSILLGSLFVSVLGWIKRLPKTFSYMLFGGTFLLVNVMMASVKSAGNAIAVTFCFVAAVSLFGAGIGAWGSAKKAGSSGVVPALLALAGGSGLCFMLIWFAWPGQAYLAPESPVIRTFPLQAEEEIPCPAVGGPFNVVELSYGSGTDKRRREFGEDAGLISAAADISAMVEKPIAPVLWLRQAYWGFGLDAVPLNGRVWYPDADGPFPLVLLVHGNHLMDDFSDHGYGYLGELLASRGYMVASIDQNFLNAGGFIEALLGGLKNENDARAYLLLRHLSLWHGWNETEGHLFEGMVDTDAIGLIGHSRGGEAVAIAAAFNHLSCHPENGDLRFDFGYNIRSIVAIAPSDRQYQPRKRDTELRDVDYLVLHGSADSDVRSFQGALQYDRVSFSRDSDHFKASVYIHGANHGQFNTRWGRIDQSFSRLFLDRANIMPAHLQELAAKVFITSFLEDGLRGHRRYRQMFTKPFITQRLLPEIFCHIQYRDGGVIPVADFEEDMDLTTITLPGGKASGEHLVSWREEPVELGGGRLRNAMSVHLSWDNDRSGDAAYILALPEGSTVDVGAGAFTFAAANVSDNREHLDFAIEMVDRFGEKAMLRLNHIATLPPPSQYRMFKKPLGVEFLSEPVFSTYSFLLSDFTRVNSSFRPRSIAEIRFIFPDSPGSVYLTDMGFYPW